MIHAMYLGNACRNSIFVDAASAGCSGECVQLLFSQLNDILQATSRDYMPYVAFVAMYQVPATEAASSV